LSGENSSTDGDQGPDGRISEADGEPALGRIGHERRARAPKLPFAIGITFTANPPLGAAA
jgi:hypothetical protein